MPVDKSQNVIGSGRIYSTSNDKLAGNGRSKDPRMGWLIRTQEVCIDARTRKHKDVVSGLFRER